MTTLLTLMISLYLGFHAARMDPRPEDRKDGEIADGAGELGFFPPYSWWPLWCAMALGTVVFATAMARLVAVHHRRRHRHGRRCAAGSSSTTAESTRTDSGRPVRARGDASRRRTGVPGLSGQPPAGYR